jgi:hypothetical protein
MEKNAMTVFAMQFPLIAYHQIGINKYEAKILSYLQ